MTKRDASLPHHDHAEEQSCSLFGDCRRPLKYLFASMETPLNDLLRGFLGFLDYIMPTFIATVYLSMVN